jgi:hypothetical protein
MSIVRIFEYNDVASDRAGNSPTQLPQEPSINTKRGVTPKEVEISNFNVDSAVFEADTHFILVIGGADFRYVVNNYNTTADANGGSRKILSGVETLLAVNPGGFLSVVTPDPEGGDLVFNVAKNSGSLLLIFW